MQGDWYKVPPLFRPNFNNSLKMKRISTDDFDVVGKEQQVVVMLNYSRESMWRAFMTRIGLWADENCDVFFNFMKRFKTGLLSWPSSVRQNTCWVPF